MDEIEALFNLPYPTIIMGVFIFILGIDKIVYLFLKIKKILRIKFGFEEDKKTIDDRITILEKHDNWQYNEISKISKGIDDIKDRLLNKEIEDMRKTILDFCAALSSGQKFNRESFDYIFKTDENYDKLLTRYGMENNVINESMKFIREKYQEKLRNGEL